MEGLSLLLLLLVLWMLIAPIMALAGASEAKRRCARAEDQLNQLKWQLDQLTRELLALREAGVRPAAVAEPVVHAPAPREEDFPLFEELAVPEPLAERPPPLPPHGAGRVVPGWAEVAARWPAEVPSVPAPVVPESVPSEPELQAKVPLNLEQFMGVKLFAWLGGVALFFGIIFFVKYAFENNLISPATRIAMGFVTGAGLLVGGLTLHRRGTHQALSQALCATAVLILYGVTFAAYERYGFFSQAGTFLLMVLITVTAFLIAVRLNALVVAVLGMAGGFLTPVLVSTGRDELLILAGYIALLVAGLVAVSRYRNWRFLVTAAVIGTVLTQLGWFDRHFFSEGYDQGVKVLWPLGILLLFEGIFMAAAWLEQRRGGSSQHPEAATLVMIGMGWLFAFVLLGCEPVARRMEWCYGFVLAQSAAVLLLVWLRPRLMLAQAVSAGLCFLHLALWTGGYLNPGNLWAALALYLGFGAVHAVVPLLLAHRAPVEVNAALPAKLWPWAAVVPLLLGLVCILRLPEPPLAVWLVVLLLNLLVMGLVPRAGSVLPALGGLLATVVLAVVWVFTVPATQGSLGPVLGISLGFAMLFGIAGRWLGRGLGAESAEEGSEAAMERTVTAAMPVLAGMMPFGLLILAIIQLPMDNPSPVFGVALLMAVLLLGLAVLDRKSALVPAAFGGMIAVQAAWHGLSFTRDTAAVGLAWQVGCYLLFLVFPFAFRRALEGRVLPWITAAVSGVGYFLLVHDGVKHAYPGMAGRMGLLPCAFAIPSLLALVVVVRMAGGMDPVKRSKLAWFGGVALFFITLVFPIQFDRQWLTVSWALEGALLLWLFRRVPHPGLQLTGLGLLAVVFVRLVLNPAVVTDYARSAMPILNWHLYTYGIAAASLFMGAFWFTDPDRRCDACKPKAILYGMCGVLLFVLLNIEIADFFTPRDARRIDFGTGLNLARDMTYSIAWGLFALGLLIIGIWRKVRPARYAAIGLLGVTLLKLFLHDLSALASVFRIGALIGVAVIAFVASFLYQQFFNRSKPS